MGSESPIILPNASRRPHRPPDGGPSISGSMLLVHTSQGTQYHALSRPNIFAHTHAIGHVRLLSNFHVVRCSQAVRSLNCAHRNTTARSELQLGGGAPPCVSEGLLGLLIEAVEVKAAHTQMARRQVAKSSRERQWQDMRGRSAPLQHMQRAGMQSGGAQRAASHKCGGRERERRAQAKSRMACTKWVQSDPNSLKFRHNVPHFGQRAISSECWS